MGSLVHVARKCDIGKYYRFRNSPFELKDIFDAGVEYPRIEPDTPLLTDKKEDAPPTNDGQGNVKTSRSEVHGRLHYRLCID